MDSPAIVITISMVTPVKNARLVLPEMIVSHVPKAITLKQMSASRTVRAIQTHAPTANVLKLAEMLSAIAKQAMRDFSVIAVKEVT